MREKFNLPPHHITADKRQNTFCQNFLRQLLLSANVMQYPQKKKVLEEIMRSDKRINPCKQ